MRSLYRFITKYFTIFLFLLLEGLALGLISQNESYQHFVLQDWSKQYSGKVYSVYASITDYFSLRKDNIRLAGENARLRAQIESAFIKFSRATILVNDTVYKQQYQYTEAKVLSNSVCKKDNYLLLNKGAADGIKPDMAVISPDGIVGVVDQVSENFSSVMSVLHSDSRKSVKIKKTSAFGSLVWEGGNYHYAQLIELPSSFPLEVGDTVVTSGFSQEFPEGIVVGTVLSFQRDSSNGFYHAKVKFSTDYNALNYVYIVNNLFKFELNQLSNRKEENE